MKFLKALFIFLCSINIYAIDYYVQGQLNFEDRPLLKAEVTDVDANDLGVQLKAVFRTNAGNNVGELLILVTPVSYGAMDSLKLKFNHLALGGSCSDPAYTSGADCDANGGTWTPTSGMIVHRHDVIDNVAATDYSTYSLYDGGPSYFTSSCSKSQLIEHTDCIGQPIAITIPEPGLVWGVGDAVTKGAGNEYDGVINPSPVDSFIDFSKLFYIDNSTTGEMIRHDLVGSYILNLPINLGYSREKVDWYSAYFGNETIIHGGVDLSTCDIWQPLSASCQSAYDDYFSGGILYGGSGFDFLNLKSKVSSGQRTDLIGLTGDGIITPDFNISQIGPSESRTAPTFEGPNQWDIDRINNNFDHIAEYFTEANTTGGAHSSAVSHDSIRHLRYLCHILDCPGNGLDDPNEGEEITSPEGSGSITCDEDNSVIELTADFNQNTSNYVTGVDTNGDCYYNPPTGAHGWRHCPVWSTNLGSVGGYDEVNNSCITPVPYPVQSSYTQKSYIDVTYRKSDGSFLTSPAPGVVVKIYEECKGCAGWVPSPMWVDNGNGGYHKDNLIVGSTITSAVDSCSNVSSSSTYRINDITTEASQTFVESIYYQIQYYWVYQGHNGKLCASRITWMSEYGSPWSVD